MFYNEENNYFDMYENEYELDKSIHNDINVNINSINFNRDNELYSVIDGFNKGNMFPNLYSKYKNHMYKLKVNSEKDELLYKIQMYSFALKDYNLYLDVYPDDVNMLREFRTVKTMLKDVKSKYEEKYGPLCVMDVESTSRWTWLNEPWPWDKGGSY